MEETVEKFNNLVETMMKLSEYIKVFNSGFVPTGDEAVKQVRKETNTLFKNIHNLSSDVRDCLDRAVYKGGQA